MPESSSPTRTPPPFTQQPPREAAVRLSRHAILLDDPGIARRDTSGRRYVANLPVVPTVVPTAMSDTSSPSTVGEAGDAYRRWRQVGWGRQRRRFKSDRPDFHGPELPGGLGMLLQYLKTPRPGSCCKR